MHAARRARRLALVLGLALTAAVSTVPTASSAVAADPVGSLVSDSFSRSMTGGLGSADQGGRWVSSSDQWVAEGLGRLELPAAGTSSDAALPDVASTDTDVSATLGLSQPPAGSSTYAYLDGRRVADAGQYRAKVRWTPTGSVTVALLQVLGTTERTLATATVPGASSTSGTPLRLRLRVRGTGTTSLAAKAWPTGTAEPSAWLLSASDSASSLQVAGSVGVAAYLSASATRPTAVFVDDVSASRPAVDLVSGPAAGQRVASASATFGFTSSRSPVTFSCRLDGSAWAGCASPASLTGLAEGAHVFEVRASDDLSSVSTSRSWSVDTVAPAATITSGPAQGSSTTSTSATLSFTGSESGSWQCRLDAAPWGACSSPFTVTELAPGTRSVQVRTTDAAGNVSPAAARSWTVSGPTTPTTTPTGTRPSAATTGVPDGLALRRIDGNLTITTPGTVLDGVDVHGFVRIRANDVTIRRSVVRGGVASSNIGLITNDSGNTGLLVEDVTLVPAHPSVWIDGVKGRGFTVRRAEISGTVDGVKVYGDDVRVEGSWIHHLTDYASDPNHGGGPSHNDGVQVLGGARIAVVGNSISGGSNAALQVTQDYSATTALVFSRNHADGGGCTVNLAHKRLASMSGITVTDNRFGRATRYADCAVLASTMTTMTTSGNVWEDDGQPVRIRNNG